MDFTSSFFEQEPEFMAVSTAAEESGEGGGWAAWAESTSSSNSNSNSSNDDDDDMFDPFVLQGDNNKERRIENKQCIINNNSTKMNSCLPVVLPGKHRKISYYSVSSGVSSSGCGDSKNSSSSSSSVGGAGAGCGPLGPWRVDLDDSALLTSHDDSIIISNTIKQQQTKQQQPTKQQQQVVSSHCLVDLDDTALIESDDLDDDDEDENGNFNDSNDPAEKHGISSSSPTSSSSSPTTRTTTTSAVSPIDPWRFDVDRRYHDHDDGYSPHDDGYDCSTRSTSHNVGMMDQLLDSPDGPLFHDGSMDDVHHIGKSMSMSDSHRHHPHHDCSSLDPWIEIVSTNDDSINGGGGTPFRASHSDNHHHHPHQQQQRPEALPEYDNEEDEEGRDDSSGNNNDNNDYFGAPTSQKKMIDEDAIGTGRSSASPINTSYLSTIFPDVARNVTAAAAVCTTSAAASTPSTTATTLQNQHCPINEDSFGFAPFHALGGEDVGINDKEGEESFREANVFGLDDHPSSNDAAADGKGDHHHRHHPKDGSYYSPPDNVDPYNSLAVYDEDDSTTDGFEESTAAHAVDHFHQDNDDEDEEDDDAGDHAQNTTPPSFVKGRSKMAPSEEQQQQLHDDEDDEDDEYKDSLDERENDEIVLVAQVEISDVEGAFEITATTSGEAVAAAAQDEDDDAAIEAADHIATAAASLVSVVDDPPLQVVESVDDDDTYQQDQDDDNDDDDEDSHHDDVKDGRLYRPNRSATSSADHGSFSGPASTSYSSNSLNTSGPSWAESTKSSGSSFTSIEQSKHWITLIVAHELWSDDCKVVEMAMGTLHRILLRSILHTPQTNNNNNTNNKDNSHSLITESMSSHSGSASSQKRGKANSGSNRANTNKRNELIELAFCRGCPLAVIRAMKAHPTNSFLQDSGLCILNVFCWTGVATHVVEVGSLERAMAAIEQSKDMDTDEEKAVANRRNNSCNTKGAPEVVESAIYHIANLLRDKNLAARVLEAGGLEAIVNAMKRLSTQSDVQLAGCCAFRNLLQHHQRIVFGRQWANKVVEVGAIDRVIAALDDHPGNEKLQLEGYKILRRLSKLNEDRHGSRQGVDSHDDCHGEQVSECYFRTKNLDASDSFAPSFEI